MYQKREASKKRLVKGIRIFLKKKKTKSSNILVNDIEIFQKMKKKKKKKRTKHIIEKIDL